MKRIIDVDAEIKGKHFDTALNKFFRKYPSLESDWRELFEYMHENNEDFESDDKMNDGSNNFDWSFALHLDEYEDRFYFAVIVRE